MRITPLFLFLPSEQLDGMVALIDRPQTNRQTHNIDAGSCCSGLNRGGGGGGDGGSGVEGEGGGTSKQAYRQAGGQIDRLAGR